jgi:aspartate aminotransferase
MTSTLTNAHPGSSSAPAASPPRNRFSGLAGSSILAIANEVRALQAAGHQVCNLSIGDFDPREFPIPDSLRERIEVALRTETNYPPSAGVAAFREQVAALYAREFGLTIPTASIVITGGSRPAIYAAYQLALMPGDRVVFPVPSWNNDHYCMLAGAVPVPVECARDTAFLPTAELLGKRLKGARMLVLNSPVNPSGTAFDAATLGAICDAVLEENARRAPGEPPLYLLYDQVYWMLTFGGLEHVMPQVLRPEIAPYTILVDGISKSFAATGLRVGWICAPAALASPLDAFLGHVGAWAPRPMQVATAQMLADPEAVAAARRAMQTGLERRLTRLHDGLLALRDEGLPVQVVAPQGGMYLSARFGMPLRGGTAPAAATTTDAMRRYLLEEAGLAAVPFEAFGFAGEPGWFRLSVGSVSERAIDELLVRLRSALGAPRGAS